MGIPIPMGAIGKLGIPGILLVVGIVVLSSMFGGASQDPAAAPAGDPDSELVDFLSFVLDDIQNEWEDIFRLSGMQYERAELVLFDGYTESACGGASEVVGPHYCPLDRRVYLDLGFFRALSERYGAKGDFAQAYVLAHEIGHHVQNLLGTLGEVQAMQGSGRGDPNELSVRLELQADCYAGVWGHTTFQRDLLESGDLEEALTAAAAVGDDRLQGASSGSVDPETFTHGTSEQRMTWFRVGFDTGDPAACDTFTGDV
ncbi:MAG: hypothetical protein KatS3mg011_2078 [Acidimicrobiia bacterium]|nr:MAG: hypothetical protein KatS3mg011_2078 [Acidimicrobiia bacterium]